MHQQTLTAQARPTGTYDIVVCGGGPAGTAAAIAAARAGARTLLVEQTGCLGGAATNAMVSVWLGSFTRDHQHKVVAGIFDEIVEKLVAENAAIRAEDDVTTDSRHVGYGAIHGRSVPFCVEPCKRVLENICADAGVHLRYFTTFVDSRIDKNRIRGVFLHGKSGFTYVQAHAVVDATGDADVAHRAGCPTRKGRDTDHGMSPGTLIFQVEDVDSHALQDYCLNTGDVRFRQIITTLQHNGQWPFHFDALVLCEAPRRGSLFVNAQLQPDLDGTDEQSMTKGIINARREVHQLIRLMCRHIPGFTNARMTASAPVIGIRETRRIVGQYTLTVDDARGETHFPDTIALTGFGWDLGDPKKASHQPMFGKHFGLAYTEIPYRCLVPQTIENLIVAGRCISVERDVLGPVRIQPTCFAMGQAAGTAAARLIQNNKTFATIDTNALRQDLVNAQAIVSCSAQLDQPLLDSWVQKHMKETGHTA